MYGTFELDTPIYLVVYSIMGTWVNGAPVYKLIKVYACDFCDIDGLLQQHPDTQSQWMCFYREPANPFQGVAVNMGDPFGSPLAMEYPQVMQEVQAERDRLNAKPEIKWDTDPFLPDRDDSVWEM